MITSGTFESHNTLRRKTGYASSILNYNVEKVTDLVDFHRNVLLYLREILHAVFSKNRILSIVLTLFYSCIFIFNSMIVRNILFGRFYLLFNHLGKLLFNVLQLLVNFSFSVALLISCRNQILTQLILDLS